jgi:phospholipid-binding lipoprotein MlaA
MTPSLSRRPLRPLAAAAAVLLALCVPALARASTAGDANDPLEPVNRAIFEVNELFDRVLLRPAAVFYRNNIPEPVRNGVTNVLHNLRSPLTFANEVLQGDVHGAGVAVARFALNSTVGIGGILDVAAENGMPYQYESLDQTLAVWGVPEGPYLVLPVFGSSSLRDAGGFGVEFFYDPFNLWLDHNDLNEVVLARGGITGIDQRATYLEALDDMKRNSFDYYAAMRSLYRQRRDNWIRDGAPPPDQPTFDDIP